MRCIDIKTLDRRKVLIPFDYFIVTEPECTLEVRFKPTSPWQRSIIPSMSSNLQERSAPSSRQSHFGKLATMEAGRRRVRFDLASLLGLPRSYERSTSLRSLRGPHEGNVAINSSTSRADKMTICAPKARYRKVKSEFEATVARQTEDLQRQRRNIALCRRRRLIKEKRTSHGRETKSSDHRSPQDNLISTR